MQQLHAILPRAIHECTCKYFNSQTGTRTRANSFPRVTRTHESSTHELQVHPLSCKYLRVPAGTHRYSQVLAGSQRQKRAQRYVSFLIYIFNLFIYITTKPTKAHSSQQWPMQAHSGQRRPMQGQRQPMQANEGHSAAIDDRYVCFLIYILFFVFLLLQSTRRPTAANKGQCRPTKTKKGPTSASICPPQPPTSHHDSLVVTPLLLLE